MSSFKRKSIRLKGYDYSQEGFYFITICTDNKKCIFGKIEDSQQMDIVGAKNFSPVMFLNETGRIADKCWLEIPKHFSHAILHEHIIMPNHVHGIIELIEIAESRAKGFSPLQTEYKTSFTSPSKTIGSIVRGFKIGVTKWLRNYRMEDYPIQRMVWQRDYYEHVIRDEKEYCKITDYIVNNAAKWRDDRFYIE